jgi:uncharacterized membrane protein
MYSKSPRQWIIEHDERWVFTLSYVALAVGLSLWLGLFWLVVLVGVHFSFEWVRQTQRFSSRWEVLGEALWEVKLDLALVLFALALSLYLDLLFGLLGLRSAGQLSAAVRAGVRAAPRAGVWQTALRGILLSLDDVVHVARGILRGRNKGEGRRGAVSPRAPTPPMTIQVSRLSSWKTGDWLALGLMAGCVVMIVVAPALTEHSAASVVAKLLEELKPIP